MNIRSKIFSLLFLLIPAYGGKVDNQTIEHVYINPAYRTTIVAGSAGSKEKLSSGKGPEKTLAKYIEDYGYGHLQAVNRTHLYWSWENTHENVRPIFQDYLWIVQEKHGMRSLPEDVLPVPEVEDSQKNIRI